MRNDLAGLRLSSRCRRGGAARRTWSWLTGGRAWLLAVSLVVTAARAEGGASDEAVRDEFLPLVKLAPLVVNGEQLSISIHARTKRDRRYAETFAEAVMKVVYEGVTDSTGKGLVIIGQKGEPHPTVVFRKFLALAQEGRLDPVIAARGPELSAMLNHWQRMVNNGKPAGKGGGDGKADLEFEKLVTALPLPLQGIGAKLYQLAWAERFDDAKVEAKLRGLRPGDLERRDLFAHFDWVFYLPPKGALEHVLDELIAEALKEEEAGFMARAAVKGAMLVVRPKIRRTIEVLRQGVMFMTVVQARTTHDEAAVSALTGSYIEALMAGGKSSSGAEQARAVKAVREQLRRSAEKARERLAAAEEPADEERLPDEDEEKDKWPALAGRA